MKRQQSLEKKSSLLQEISRVFTATNNINALANLAIDLALNNTTAKKGSVMLLNDKNELYIAAARNLSMELIENYRLKMGEGIAGVIVQNRIPVLVENIEKDQRFKYVNGDRYETKSFISCPLVSRDKIIGILNISDKKDSTPFTKDEFNLLKIIADQAATSIENASLMNELNMKTAELEEINRKLIEADRHKTEFITRISHELRSPLNSIKGAIYYLRRSENIKKDKVEEFYDIISAETAGLVSIVENLLDFLRRENEAKIIKKAIINLEEILNELSKSKGINNIFIRKNLQFELNIKQGDFQIVGDKVKVVQLFINLIEGLSFYMQSGDRMEVSVYGNASTKVDITVFRKFPDEISFFLYKSKYIFYADVPDEKLRLSLAKNIVEAHGWTFEAKNSDNSFLVSLTIPKATKEKIETVVNMTMDMFVELISELLDLNICSIMLCNDITSDLTIRGARGLTDEIVERTRVNLGDQISGWVAIEGKPLLIEDIEKHSFFKRKNIPQYSTKSLLSLPLKTKDKVIGVLNMTNKKTASTFNTSDLYIASVFSERISYFVEKLYAGGYREDDMERVLSSLDNLLDAVKRYHKKRRPLPDLVLKIMDKFGAGEEDKRNSLYVSAIHDIGLMIIDENILAKKSRLSSSEIDDIRIHPYTTIALLNIFEFSDDIKNAILHHHEKYDGTGYPGGLKGSEIPFISRVLSVADSYCAMISERPYRKLLTKKEALSEIEAGSGSFYDPEIVNALEDVLREDQSPERHLLNNISR